MDRQKGKAQTPVVGEIDVLQALATREPWRDVRGDGVAELVVAEVEVREGGHLVEEDAEDGDAARLDRVAAEVEEREGVAGGEDGGERGDARVLQAVETEVEMAQACTGTERGQEREQAVRAHVVAAQVEVRETRAAWERLRDDDDAHGPDVAVAADVQALEVRA